MKNWHQQAKNMVEMIRKHDHAHSGDKPITEATLKAFLEVPRHLFVPQAQQSLAYDDRPLPIGGGQTISQPYIVALMTDLLEVLAGDKVLEIGTGSGYQAAILATLSINVFSVEIQANLISGLKSLYNDVNISNILFKQGDGYFGWQEHAPYDGIMITAATKEIPSPLIEQLKVGGKIVIPLEENSRQTLYQITKLESGLEKKPILEVRFVPFVRE